MIHIYHQEIDGVWYANAMDDETVFATAFSWDERDVLQRLLRSLPYNIPFQMAEKATQLSQLWLTKLKGMYDGKDVSASFKLAYNHLPNYTRKVLNCVSLIPIGYVTTYNAIAKAVGGSPRAVGRALAANPFPLLIPCHRVIYRDFSIGGYDLGEKVKRELLQRENRNYKDAHEVRVGDKVLALYPIRFLRKV